MIRRIAAAALALLAAWLFWQGLSAVLIITSRGSPLDDALLQPPTQASGASSPPALRCSAAFWRRSTCEAAPGFR
ncbi:hypothetical protein [Hyphomonas sp.]|uniref:hypothetical protein n=1 Tax=Hyphomonas sp. TaxID=87 RepID=UPI00391A96C0